MIRRGVNRTPVRRRLLLRCEWTVPPLPHSTEACSRPARGWHALPAPLKAGPRRSASVSLSVSRTGVPASEVCCLFNSYYVMYSCEALQNTRETGLAMSSVLPDEGAGVGRGGCQWALTEPEKQTAVCAPADARTQGRGAGSHSTRLQAVFLFGPLSQPGENLASPGIIQKL